MRRIKEVLRLKQALEQSDAAISRSARIARSTVKEYLDRAARAGLSWAVAEGLSEEEVERRLFATTEVRDQDRPVPDWEGVEQELRGRGVTLRLLWLEYLSRHPEGWRYTQFCEHFHAWQRRARPPRMRQLHRAGAALEVDWAPARRHGRPPPMVATPAAPISPPPSPPALPMSPSTRSAASPLP